MTSQEQLEYSLDQFTPKIASLARQALAKLRHLYPTASELVYDNYNALAIGFAPSAKTSEGIFSIALYPRWVSLFFLQAKDRLDDPHGLLKGSGNTVRHIVLESDQTLDDPRVRDLMDQALASAKVPFNLTVKPAIIIKSISAKQRPRRPK